MRVVRRAYDRQIKNAVVSKSPFHLPFVSRSMPISTRITRLFGIKHPIIQGGMHHVGFAELAAAVSNAGGLGTVTALSQPGPDELRAEIRKTRSLLVDPSTPIAVNLTLLPMLAPPNYSAYGDVVVEEGITVVETAGHFNGLAPFVEQFKAAGIKIIHKCVQVRHAQSAARLGVDAISMDGFDCAGHPGEMDVGNWVLLAKAGRELDIPFVASGGCATGSQLAAALALGAEGMNMGTRFMATREAPIQDGIKRALAEGTEHDTTLVMRSFKNTERVYKNETAARVQALEAEFPGEFEKIADLVRGDNYKKAFLETGNTEDSIWSCGPVMGLFDAPDQTCEQVISEIMAEAEDIIGNRLPKVIQ